jgi:flagellar basal body-associated protein FliL
LLAPPSGPLETYNLPTITGATADMEPHFVKMTISLAYYPNPELGLELANRKDEIRHIINIILQGKTFKELDNTSGVITLSEEIKSFINTSLMAGKISEIYFKEFIVN